MKVVKGFLWKLFLTRFTRLELVLVALAVVGIAAGAVIFVLMARTATTDLARASPLLPSFRIIKIVSLVLLWTGILLKMIRAARDA